MKNNPKNAIEQSFRNYYGKLFAALLNQFGSEHIDVIEDAIQNAFYKSLKSWKPNRIPDNKENWFFIVARNDVINQLKRSAKTQQGTTFNTIEDEVNTDEDLRLKTILFISKSKRISYKAKVLFILKNIFGLHIKEVSECTLISEEAIYKTIQRAKKSIHKISEEIDFGTVFKNPSQAEISIIEEILYAVFNVGFDSFNEKSESIINEDLCLEALSLTRMLSNKFKLTTTSNLLALFCFHLARVPEKIKNKKIIPFEEQDVSNWNNDLMNLAFHYLTKPEKLNIYYLEALIASKHMSELEKDVHHWNDIVALYKLILEGSNSPIVKLNLCYALSKAKKFEETRLILESLENELPEEHIYFSLVKAQFLENKTTENFENIINQTLGNINQKIRRDYILENF